MAAMKYFPSTINSALIPVKLTRLRKLRGYFKTHDNKRYTWSHLSCLPSSSTDSIYYPTWTSLQAHIREAHPPTCMHASCNGRTFASQHNLRAHQKLHEQQELEALLSSVEIPGTTDHPRKRRRGGEVGRDWKCDKCGKEFKSMKALTTHNNVIHLGSQKSRMPTLALFQCFWLQTSPRKAYD
ncbi:hypothetical protein AZE42_12387 [Rhizopogon vesiculosus]|uniref:C2H2-type domain-containing protein n=1 Tax=Rhizopogon vesiculosus TaxID=180088 RepID=A0A1J8R3A2_9AGAM|nr:hypothetical protein AZE42_12387 [Rhizopogon vesiculosus]